MRDRQRQTDRQTEERRGEGEREREKEREQERDGDFLDIAVQIKRFYLSKIFDREGFKYSGDSKRKNFYCIN